MIAIIKSDVATGRRMNGSEIFMRAREARDALRPAAASATAMVSAPHQLAQRVGAIAAEAVPVLEEAEARFRATRLHAGAVFGKVGAAILLHRGGHRRFALGACIRAGAAAGRRCGRFDRLA